MLIKVHVEDQGKKGRMVEERDPSDFMQFRAVAHGENK